MTDKPERKLYKCPTKISKEFLKHCVFATGKLPSAEEIKPYLRRFVVVSKKKAHHVR